MNKNLDIYFSDACNAQCSYCILRDREPNTNAAIRAALEDQTFVTNVRKTLTPEIRSLGFWGKEPSINGKYFGPFITNLLDYSPYIRYIMIPTNGLATDFYDNFIWPLLSYCNLHKRKIILIVQFSLDGPPDLQDRYCGTGSTEKCMNNIYNIAWRFPFENPYLRLRMSTKATLQGYDLEHYNPIKWNQFMVNFRMRILPFFPDWLDCKVGLWRATLALPGNYTKAQGQAICKWKSYFYFNKSCNCQAGDLSKTIDYQGNLYDCHLLKNQQFSQEDCHEAFEEQMTALVAQDEAIEQDRDKLFNTIMSIYCWGASDTIDFTSYIKILGNGFLL